MGEAGDTSAIGRRALIGRGVIAGAALAALGPTGVAAAATPSVGAYDLRSFGAEGDGTTDDAPALQAALNQLAADGGGEIRVTNGVYRIASPVIAGYGGDAASIIIRGQGSSSQILIATGAANRAITLQNLESLLIEDLTFRGTVGVQTDALIALSIETCLQATLRRCDFYGVSSFEANGAVVSAVSSDLRIEDSAFRGCGARSGLATSVVSVTSWMGLTIVKSDFIDYGYLNGTFFSKTPIAAPWAWVALGNITTQASPPLQGAVLLSNVNMDEGALFGLACLPNTAVSGLIESLTITGLRINVSGFGKPNNGVIIQGVEHVLIERSWFGYSPSYGSRGAINLRSVNDAVIDSCRCAQGSDRILADGAVGTLTVRETTYQHLLSDAAMTRVIQGGLEATLLKADGPIAANNLVVASPTATRRVVVAPTGAPASAILGVALDETLAAGDSTRVVMTRGSIVSVRSDGATAIAPGDAIGPSAVFGGRVGAVTSGQLIGRALQAGGASSSVFVAVELRDGALSPATPIPAPLQNGWTNLGGGFAPAAFVKTSENRVELTGMIQGGTTGAGTVILTLPVGFRPPSALVFPAASSGGYAEISVAANGVVAARQGVSAAYTSLSGIRFAAA
ncbi:MAG: hypothetical protein QOF77_951 [Solirubrobacteraceae bacterium]|nr:hypothetical protein [Solirubrobacteraceae bacterium]